MSKTYITKQLRTEVRSRANEQCEYCLRLEVLSIATYHVDHIISEQQGGPTNSSNLALSCAHCNQHKGTNISAYIIEQKIIVDLFNPREDVWNDHFSLLPSGALTGLTLTGSGTIRLLKLNEWDKVTERYLMLADGNSLQ